MVELQEPRGDASRTGAPYDISENHNIKNYNRKPKEDKYHSIQSFLTYQEKEEYPQDRDRTEEYAYPQDKEYRYTRQEEFPPYPYERGAPKRTAIGEHSIPNGYAISRGTGMHHTKEPLRGARSYTQPFTGRQFRSNSISGISPLSIGREMDRDKAPRHSPSEREAPRSSQNLLPPQGTTPAAEQRTGMPPLRIFRNEEIEDSPESEEATGMRATKGRKKIKMEFIKDKGRRGVTFSKRKKGIMKKAYELNVLTKCEILLIVSSETGHVYTFATPKLQPIIKQHENLIQQYLNAPGIGEIGKMYETPERFSSDSGGYYKNNDAYGYDGILRGHGYPSGYYHGGYETDNSPEGGPRL
ncbi:hypothetical protein NEFER03_2070 [Nematocida sp. LUAm3]|nr:hypothetical protein NEFER03_2070 [Nematocida sp. LUAm3]KAI5176212.1 hypothetical protein NEFER02_2018 [Nematocida sp. LUAm2]KAI5179200.1 hypothetical protein NEFER01_2057 [Nematocida sp. LUAm1]